MPSDTGEIGFDEEWYLATNPDVARAVAAGGVDTGLTHYLTHGREEGRRPHPTFDASWYLRAYPSAVDEAGSDAPEALEQHYHERGQFRGYLPYRLAKRPRNPAAVPSPFGGLWIDAGNALDLIDGRRRLGWITAQEAALLEHFTTRGYAIIPDAVPASLLDRAEEVVENGYHGRMPALRFECQALPGHIEWCSEVLRFPSRALDLHWFSRDVRNVVFYPGILRFLHLLFERPILASQTLCFYNGSQQETHQDSAYVPYSLPRQFVATWIALEDVTAGTGELEYLVSSHSQLPEFLYGGEYKSVYDAQRFGAGSNTIGEAVNRHQASLQEEAAARQLVRERFLARRGDVLVWHADLAHGGSPTSSNRTRKSLVTHCCPIEIAPLYFENGMPSIRRHDSGSFYASSLYASSQAV